MARLPTTADAFNAIAETQRRNILELLSTRQHYSVNEIAQRLGIRQPQVSKHLQVLKEVGLVTLQSVGQQRLYSLNAEALKPIFDWVKPFEQHWTESFDRLDEYLKTLQKSI